MKHNYCLKVLLASVVGVFGWLLSSCTSDDFFGIKENYEGIDYSMMKRIALSKEYVEYQKQTILMLNAMQSIDTTKKVMVRCYEGMAVYAYEEIVSMRPFMDAYQVLVESYPEYDKTSIEEKRQISNLAYMNSRTLSNMVERYGVGAPPTKSCNPESMAYRYAQDSEALKINTRAWRIGNLGCYIADDEYGTIVQMALDRSAEDGKEHGGFGFSDNSALLVEDFNATDTSMIPYWSSYPSFQPIKDFHVHPNGDLNCSWTDIFTWGLTLPWDEHWIVTKNGSERYEVSFLFN